MTDTTNPNSHYFAHDVEGNITTTGNCVLSALSSMQLGAGETAVAGEADPELQYFDVASGDLRYYTTAQVNARQSRPGSGWRWSVAAMAWLDQRTLDELKAIQLAAVNAAYEAAIAALTAGYPASEIATWPNQQKDAEAWAADPDAATPYIDGIAAARGIDRITLLGLALANVKEFLAATTDFTGTRQRLRDAIAAAKTPEAVQAITWSLS